MKKAIILILVIVAILCSCAKKPKLESSLMPKIPSDNVFVFECDKDEYYTVHYQDDFAFLYHGYDMYKLPRAISADGARYSDGTNEFWNKGDMAMITIGDTYYQNCQLVDPQDIKIKIPADYFWGMSNDPLWSLSIYNSEIAVFFHKNDKTYRFNSSTCTDSGEGEKMYIAQSKDHEVKVIITEMQCFDKKSDQTFPYKVKLILDGKEYSGCGNAPK